MERDLARAQAPWDQLCEWTDGASEVAWGQTKASGRNLEGKTAALAALTSYDEGCIISLLVLS